jgi:hypothetical protein
MAFLSHILLVPSTLQATWLDPHCANLWTSELLEKRGDRLGID